MRIPRIAVFLLAGSVLLGFQDEAQITRWVSDLVHADPARRADAERQLLKAGAKALPALKAAFESKTPDLPGKAKSVAAEIERLEAEKAYDATQRPRRLEIVTLQQKDAPLGDALKTLGKQVDTTLHAAVDAKQKLTIDVKDVPLRKCLDQIEEILKVNIQSRYTWHKVTAGPAPKRKRAYVPGATFDFSLVPFKPEGQAPGWSLMTESSGPATAFIDAFEVVDAQKAPVAIDRCGRCGSRFILLKTEKQAPFTVKLKGRLVWESPYELAVTDPTKPQDFKVSMFAIKYEWLKLAWTTPEPVPAQLIGRAEFAPKLKKQFQAPGATGAMGVGITPPEARPTKTWCACASGPVGYQPMPAALANAGSYVDPGIRIRKPEHFDSLKVRFYKGIEEPFEVEAQVAAD